MLDFVLVLVLFLVAIAFAVSEVFIPSGGLLGLLGLTAIGASLFVAYTRFAGQFWWIFIAELVGFFAVVIPSILVAVKRFSLQSSQKAEDGYTSAVEGLDAYVGKEAVAVTPLRPSGTVRIGDKRIDAVTQGDFCPAGATVTVLSAASNRLIVGALPENEERDAQPEGT